MVSKNVCNQRVRVKLVDIQRYIQNQEDCDEKTTVIQYPPAKIGRYHIIKKIGSGGMGTVYCAHDPCLDRTVALKILNYLKNGEIVRFRQEAKTVARLSHPNIVPIFDFGEKNDIYFLVMEHVVGSSLDVFPMKKLTFMQVARIICQVAEAVHYAHEQNIIHRDLKPANIMMKSINNRVYPQLLDFGLARILNTSRISREGLVCGTPGYMSPEQIRGKADEIDAKSDVYSLGATLYKMLTGSPPFQGRISKMVRLVLTKDPISPCEINTAVPQRLGEICLKSLAKNKLERFQSAKEFARALKNFGIQQ